MFRQCSYSVRIYLLPRLVSFLLVAVLNITFAACGLGNLYGMGGQTVAVSLSGVALAGLFVVIGLADAESIRSLFGAPAGYLTMLTPVPGWKILLGRVLPIVLLDALTLGTGILGATVQSFILGGVRFSDLDTNAGELALSIVVLLLGYALFILAIFFTVALSRSLLFRCRGRTLLAILVTAGILYLMSLLNLVLIPFTGVIRYGMMFMIDVGLGFNAGTAVLALLYLIKLSALFAGTAWLMERKINL